MEIPTPVCALVRNDTLFEAHAHLYKFQFHDQLIKTDNHIPHLSIGSLRESRQRVPEVPN